MRRALLTLCLFAGLTCISGGLELVLTPDGSLVGLPLSLLRYSPFADYLVPGLLLAGVVGAASTVAGVLLLARRPAANGASIVAGVALATWISVEMALLRSFHWLHGVYLALAISILVLAMAREARAGLLATTLRSLGRVTIHAFVGWTLCAATMGALLARSNVTMALLVHGLAVPLVFALVSAHYFGRRNAWTPFRTALAFTGLVALLDLVVVASFIQRDLAMFRSAFGTWLPLSLILLTTWATGLASTGTGSSSVSVRRA